MIYRQVQEIASTHHFLSLPNLVSGSNTYLKIEGLNLAGSIKLKAAVAMVQAAETSGRLQPGGHLIESSSGSLGVALATISAASGYIFTCVVDPNISPTSLAIIRSLGARIVMVENVDANGGYLHSRIETVHRLVTADPAIVWLDQYSNPFNARSHRDGTAAEITSQFPRIDYLFVGVGTAGTLTGCLDHFEQNSPRTKVIAVDAVGSVTFGGPVSPRRIPGLGASRTPPLFSSGRAHEQVQITETDAIRTCRRLAREYGYLAGGSTGSIIAAVLGMQSRIDPDSVIVALAPDVGDRYVDTIYNDEWVAFHYRGETIGAAN